MPADRAAILADMQALYSGLRGDLLERAVVLPFTNPTRAGVVLMHRMEEMRQQRDVGFLAVDSLIAAGRADLATTVAEALFDAPDSGAADLRAVVRAHRAAGRDTADTIARTDAHLARYPDDHANRLRKARLLMGRRRWNEALAEASRILKAEPDNVAAAEVAVGALTRLDRPEDAAALREEVAAAYSRGDPDDTLRLVALDLAAADAESAVARGLATTAEPGEPARFEAARAEALIAAGDYATALEILTRHAAASDDMELRGKAIQCAVALRHAEGPGARFPGETFRLGLSRQRPQGDVPRGAALLVTSTLGAGGAERQIALTASRIPPLLAPRGVTTHLVVRDLTPEYGNSTMLPLLAGSAAEVVDLTAADASLLARELDAAGALTEEDRQLLSAFPANLARTIVVLLGTFRRLNPRVVHLWQDGIIGLGGVAAVLAGVPRIVCSIRNVVPPETDTRRYRPYLGTIYRTLAARPEVRLTANSASGARDYEAAFGLVPGSIGVIRNALETEVLEARAGPDGRARARSEMGVAPHEPVLGGVFRLVPAKRPHRWLDTAARIAADLPEARFLLVGEGPLRAELEGYAATLGIGERVTFAGRRSPVEPWIAAMDLMLLASDLEGLPNVLLEAQALGVPVVTTSAGGAAEAVDEGVSGTVVETMEVEALAAACLSFLGDRGRREHARVQGPAFIRDRFGMERMLKETAEAYFGGDAGPPDR